MIEKAIKTIGGAHAGLSALVGAGATSRIYAGQAPQNATLPYLVFIKDGDFRPVPGVYVNSGWGYSDIGFEFHAATLLGAKEGMLQVRAAYDRYGPATVDGVAIDPVGTLASGGGGEDYDYDLDHHIAEGDITFFHTE
jgi:hypothetical protein